MSPTIVLHHGRPFLALGAAGGPTIITTVLQILINRIDLHMSLPAAIAAPRASQQNTPTTQAEPAFIALPTTHALESLGQSFAIKTASLLYPDFTIPPTIGVATGLELLSRGRMLAAGEPVRRGGSAAGVLVPSAHLAVSAQQRRRENR
jgi:gamma-glutamyltranspeptidase/glutathione hydrolase